ncbi:UDP-N-acetylmuramoyl-tripeptide--D-alanyl-D-alanine ligase [Cupriavidus sp. UYPR2.512]|uniref:UDP-N-acetylmuramoyl-tripeptide--D-alanyl-D- alanine ligase n=1 Tax=Cupriavidus sp. UYPR2.512 TaxID=1080187 RepID=UPI00039E9455|nr:UDP-N-acetylmuramoyl-tripeptide--D-alanyl-D-alanine ligase [Cupriavidus sp. UYPR2.512]UIF85775.1 UDP-N-acetylmuramoyl-tripeptide--D-alanyl-D-alanine ligase [Cupriavidus necator]
MSQTPMTTLQQAAGWIAGARVCGDGAVQFSRVHTDSRSVEPGDLFVALKGERFDAHDFIADVVARGAAAVLVSREVDAGVPAIVAPDTRIALGELGAGWRRQFTLPAVAVTGSNGKTTVKEMIAAIFAAAVGEDQRLATGGNLNNDIGLPLTVLRLRAAHKLAVLELGMNHPGETVYLAGIAQPTVAVITNAQREHQEFMVSVEAVAHEHAAAIAALPAHGVAVYPLDAESGGAHAPVWREAAGERRALSFGTSQRADVHATVTLFDGAQVMQVRAPGHAFDVRLALLGEHNVRNALAAIACALAAGVHVPAIQSGLAGFHAVKGRLQVKYTPGGTVVIDDTYNANPDSMRAAIDVLAGFAAPRILVLGDMGEVGDQGPAFHQEIGAYAKARGVGTLWATGELAVHAVQAFGAGGRHFGTAQALTKALEEDSRGMVAQAGAVLVKGSRFMRMERMVAALVADTSAH